MIYSMEKSHYTYSFTHQDILLHAYDDLGRTLERLRREIQHKYSLMLYDAQKYVFYKELIPNLERQFCNMVIEGLKAGSIKIVAVGLNGRERKVA